MPADNRSVVITLKLDKGQQTDASESVETSKTSSETDKGSVKKAVAGFAVVQSVEIVAREVIAWGEYQWNKELNLNDDYIGQRTKTFALTQINRGISAISSIGSSAAYGAMIGGPVGALVGAAVGTATATAGIVRSNLQGNEQQNIMLRQMNAQLSYTRQRAGWSLEAASIGEDL